MSLSLKDIAVMISNGELPKISDVELSAERMKICCTCDQYKKLSRQCDLCGCFLDLKTKLLQASCPAGLW